MAVTPLAACPDIQPCGRWLQDVPNQLRIRLRTRLIRLPAQIMSIWRFDKSAISPVIKGMLSLLAHGWTCISEDANGKHGFRLHASASFHGIDATAGLIADIDAEVIKTSGGEPGISGRWQGSDEDGRHRHAGHPLRSSDLAE